MQMKKHKNLSKKSGSNCGNCTSPRVATYNHGTRNWHTLLRKRRRTAPSHAELSRAHSELPRAAQKIPRAPSEPLKLSRACFEPPRAAQKIPRAPSEDSASRLRVLRRLSEHAPNLPRTVSPGKSTRQKKHTQFNVPHTTPKQHKNKFSGMHSSKEAR